LSSTISAPFAFASSIAVQAIKMPLIDDRGVVRIVLQRREHRADARRRCADEFTCLRLRHHDIVRRQADLTGIQRLAHHHALCRQRHIGGLTDDDR